MADDMDYAAWATTPVVRHSTLWPGKCRCGKRTFMVSHDLPTKSGGAVFECKPCHETRRAMEALGDLVEPAKPEQPLGPWPPRRHRGRMKWA